MDHLDLRVLPPRLHRHRDFGALTRTAEKLLDSFRDMTEDRVGYAFRAWIVAVVPSLAYFLVLVSIGVETLCAPAGAFAPAPAIYGIVASPLLETALMLPVALVLNRLVPRTERIRIVLLAAIFALAHKFGGGWRQVIASLWPFLVYAATLTAWLKRSNRDAFAVTALVHALYNATFFGIGALGALLAHADS